MQNICVFLTTEIEGHFTYTREDLSIAYKLVFLKCINVGLIPILASQTDDWFKPYGLCESSFTNILVFIII